ncbi:hypothetical protein [Marinomonas fungiae]|uniref:Uncharacterized protein n=1 Tax=Marinomonas fungiae TaxID=1137284 RepID=A0A0K6ILY1_9GAMM|nr:hypothetical protein [Marinomonas fungiae]CUB04098.1 hypothetical protein Ga0061065_105190 [Marinomonas fungiae]
MAKFDFSKALKLVSVALVASSALTVSAAEREADDCTPRLEKYLQTLRDNVSSDYISPRQKEASQKLLDKAARLKANTEYHYTDCAVFDKLLF